MIAMWYLSKDDAVGHVIVRLNRAYQNQEDRQKVFNKFQNALVLFEMKNRLKDDNVDIKLVALEIICGYGGWHALESICL